MLPKYNAIYVKNTKNSDRQKFKVMTNSNDTGIHILENSLVNNPLLYFSRQIHKLQCPLNRNAFSK